MQSHAKRRAAIARGSDAAAKMRRAVNKSGGAYCAAHGGWMPSSLIDIDHIIPLARGGEDVEGNVQALCKECHRAKTAKDFPRYGGAVRKFSG